ncbi:quinoprotein relay system zinc metallohydrolase 2 [Arenibaculum pallidiluteum]|uniref:quinoprotein relay system zinc metallohydrolase 2 n=1 Tax=Arenibaculum pallidiluteum TaxID=2812559 RepID=UPI001F359836|nr:quinoprotein relay system zinc metallohydrolase 2 [Arenibaculum pallidiluteum]
MRPPPAMTAARAAPTLAAAALALLWAGAGAAQELPVREVAPGVFVHEGAHEETAPGNGGDIANIGFVVGEDAVAVIDTGGSPAIGRRLRAAVESRTRKPVRYVVNTHMHPDHVFGNGAFPEAELVGHANLADALARRLETYKARLAEELGPEAAAGIGAPEVDVAVADRLRLDLGGRALEIQAFPTAHTNNDVTVLDPATGTLFTGDLLFVERVPAVDGSALGWLRAMDALAAQPAARVVPGHGPTLEGWPASLAAQRRYLDSLVTEVRQALKAGRGLSETVERAATAEGLGWALFETYHPRNVTAVYAELEWE